MWSRRLETRTRPPVIYRSVGYAPQGEHALWWNLSQKRYYDIPKALPESDGKPRKASRERLHAQRLGCYLLWRHSAKTATAWVMSTNWHAAAIRVRDRGTTCPALFARVKSENKQPQNPKQMSAILVDISY